MSNKWEQFQSSYSPLDPTHINTGSSRIEEDWKRAANSNQITINGHPLKDFPKAINFENEQEVRHFFNNIILNQLDKDIDKARAVEFLMASFHQGGLMYPASTSLTEVLKNEKGQGLMLPGSDKADLKKQINIVTSNNGFTIQECYSVRKCFIPLSDDVPEVLAKAADEDNVIIPDKKEVDYVIKAAVTLKVNFKNDASRPKLTVKENLISYGNTGVEKVLDKRNFLQVIVDVFRKLLNLNVVQELSSSKVGQDNSQPRDDESSNYSI